MIALQDNFPASRINAKPKGITRGSRPTPHLAVVSQTKSLPYPDEERKRCAGYLRTVVEAVKKFTSKIGLTRDARFHSLSRVVT